MSELAPGHKVGLVLDRPLMVAGGTVGYGNALPPGLDLTHFGGLVVGPVTRHPQSGPEPPRVADTPGGLVLARGLQNRGVRMVMRRYAGLWSRLPVPLLVQIGDRYPADAADTARQVALAPGVAGLELLLPRDGTPSEDQALVRAVIQAVELPVLAKLPLDASLERAQALVAAGANALVLGRPPLGMARTRQGTFLSGELYGPGVFPLMLHGLHRLATAELGVPLVACGGIHTRQQMEDALALGAVAVQVEGVMWVEGMIGEAQGITGEE